ncbi:MAG: type II toxin-antitoxin system RelE/ParE family toxin [Janthinobacterium lividum]
MRVFRNKWFTRFAGKNGLTDEMLRKAVTDAESGLVDADLGGGVIKQRIARPGGGKSGGYRSIVLFRSGSTAFFVYGFPKSARDNIDTNELAGFRELAEVMQAYDDEMLKAATDAGVWTEVDGG